MKQIKNALISVYHKEGLEDIIRLLKELNITIYSTGGTFSYIEELGVAATKVEDLTSYPGILGGRVKTLHPKVFGGILARRMVEDDQKQLTEYAIPEIDLVIVDLYPFEETVKHSKKEQEIIEKIDIGGISLIRAAAKNFTDVLIVSHVDQYEEVFELLKNNKGFSDSNDRRKFAAAAFDISSHYDSHIFNFFNRKAGIPSLKVSGRQGLGLRYGENPHQKGMFFGDLEECFTQLHGKAISYNNLVDIHGAVALINEFDEPTFSVIKHTNACGVASRENLSDAWKDALAGDPVSAFGGILITNRQIDDKTAEEINTIFFEVILAPEYKKNALEILKSKKNRIILRLINTRSGFFEFKNALNGMLWQETDRIAETKEDLKGVTKTPASEEQIEDLLFANRIVKHTKSNAIVLVKNKQLIGSGMGQTSRVDALKQAIAKAKSFNLDLKGAVMASDAFFPFADSVEIAHKEGIRAVIQPGGSIRDQDSVDFCNDNGMAMVLTGKRHFKH